MFCQDYISYKQSSHTWAYGGTSRREWWTERKRCNGAIGSSCERAAGVIAFLGLPTTVSLSLSLSQSLIVFLLVAFSLTQSLTHTHTLTSIFHLNQFSISSLRLETNLMFCLCHYRALQLWGGYSTFYISMSANTWCGRTRVHTHETTAGSLRFIQLASASHGNCIRLGATRWEAPHHIYDILWAPPPPPPSGWAERCYKNKKNQYASCKARKPHK